jgi:hypothetical protein
MRHCDPNFTAGSSFLSHILRTEGSESLRNSATSKMVIISLGGFRGALGGRESLIVAEAYQGQRLLKKMFTPNGQAI